VRKAARLLRCEAPASLEVRQDLGQDLDVQVHQRDGIRLHRRRHCSVYSSRSRPYPNPAGSVSLSVLQLFGGRFLSSRDNVSIFITDTRALHELPRRPSRNLQPKQVHRRRWCAVASHTHTCMRVPPSVPYRLRGVPPVFRGVKP
jgi:hypothetical protein